MTDLVQDHGDQIDLTEPRVGVGAEVPGLAGVDVHVDVGLARVGVRSSEERNHGNGPECAISKAEVRGTGAAQATARAIDVGQVGVHYNSEAPHVEDVREDLHGTRYRRDVISNVRWFGVEDVDIEVSYAEALGRGRAGDPRCGEVQVGDGLPWWDARGRKGWVKRTGGRQLDENKKRYW